jgi:ABC-type antimicrobial peptide transport system permease subunit
MLFDLRTLDQRRDRRLAQETFLRDLSLGLGGFALMLAASGLYGVLAFVTARRGREIALRIALGARPASVIRFVARDAALAVAAGLAIGFAAALPAVRLVRGFLYGVGTWEPLAFVIAAVALALAATAAVWLPAARAARLDPAAMLRAD